MQEYGRGNYQKGKESKIGEQRGQRREGETRKEVTGVSMSPVNKGMTAQSQIITRKLMLITECLANSSG